MLKKSVITLTVLAIVFSVLSTLLALGTPAEITSQVIQTDLPTLFSFVTVILIMAILTLILIDFLIFFKK